jgi:LuxR family quorum-sensing system transcriptional regulator CciR
LARGKSDWEIALILGISVETVRQYVKRARAAYEAVSRAQLAVLAFEDDWISRDPITPRRRPRKFPRG